MAQDVVSEARRLATGGQREAAIEMLEKHLASAPGDVDARVVYGTVLAWQGLYARARTELSRVLAENPGNGDAAQALASVELWTRHPAAAEDLLAPLLRSRASDTDVLLAHAHALIDLDRRPEALAALNRVLELDPSNRDAFRLRAGLSEVAPLWETSIRQYYESFSDGIGNRNEFQAALKRSTVLGAVIGRYSGASRFGAFANQFEVDFYPGIRKGTYAWLNVGFSPEGGLYPDYRASGELFQALGKGFEASGGYRRLGFSTPVNAWTTALSKYQGNWLFTGRGYFTPSGGATAKSLQISARRYLRSARSYLDFSYGHGSTPFGIRSAVDLQVFDTNSGGIAVEKQAGTRWLISGNAVVSHEDRAGRPAVWHRIASLGAAFRF